MGRALDEQKKAPGTERGTYTRRGLTGRCSHRADRRRRGLSRPKKRVLPTSTATIARRIEEKEKEMAYELMCAPERLIRRPRPSGERIRAQSTVAVPPDARSRGRRAGGRWHLCRQPAEISAFFTIPGPRWRLGAVVQVTLLR
jgi:hypothetical protein